MTPETFPHIQIFPLGDFQTNCHVVRPSADSDACWVADVGYEPGPLLDFIDQNALKPEVVVLTHAHADHIAGLTEFRTRHPGVPFWMHAAEESWLTDPMLNLSAALGLAVTAPAAERFVDEGETLTLCGQPWRVLHTPGHSPGSISLVHDDTNQVIAGDALFNGSIGRTDFPGSSLEQLAESIRTKLYALPEDTTVFPGHGPTTTVGREMRTNPFVPAVAPR